MIQVEWVTNQLIFKVETIVNHGNKELLSNEIDYVNQMNAQDIKDYYQRNPDKLKRKSRIDFLIKYHRISGNTIQYEIQPFDENYSIFKVQVTVDIKS